MEVALIVHVTLDDITQLQDLTDEVENLLTKGGIAVQSVVPWSRQQNTQPSLADIANALPTELKQQTPPTLQIE